MLVIKTYSEKSFAVYGDTDKVVDDLKKLGGKPNKFLRDGPGWIFSNFHREKVNKWFEKIHESKSTKTEEKHELAKTEEKKTISIYTDGSSLSNPGKSGWGVVVVNSDSDIITRSGCCVMSTNNRMELTAVIEALKYIKDTKNYTIFSDSMLTINCATGKWKRKANLDLWAEYDKEIKGKKVTFTWVKAHNGDRYNEMVDKIAYGEAINAC